MKRSIFKPIVFGILFGAAAYFAPFFLIKGILFFTFIGFIFRMIWWRGYHWGSHMRYQMVMADKIRSMSEDEYNALKNKFSNFEGRHYGRGCYGGHWNKNRRNDNDCHDYCEPKKENSGNAAENTEQK
ncbi:MAG: hypothetical protein ACXVP0_11470 [Bacteroidia bacterium]